MLGIHLSVLQIAAFQRFETALYETNEVMNLTRVPREECWYRHFLDSLIFHDLIPRGARVLDIGTGPGFPAWPLACARPDLSVTAMDSNGKMLGFLKSQPLSNLTAVNARAEEWNDKYGFDVVTGRAVAPLSTQLELSAGLCKRKGLVIPMRAASDIDGPETINLGPLGLKLDRTEKRILPGSDSIRIFPIYVKVKPTSPGYPRRWADMKAKPL